MMGRPFSRVGRVRRVLEINAPEVISEVNLTPLVDMALTLIVVFLIFLPALTTLIPITSTSSGGGQQAGEEKTEAPLILILTNDKIMLGNYEFDSFEKMIPWMRDIFAQRKDHKVTVKTAPDVPQQRLVTLLDDVRQSGEWKVALTVLNEDKP